MKTEVELTNESKESEVLMKGLEEMKFFHPKYRYEGLITMLRQLRQELENFEIKLNDLEIKIDEFINS